MEFKKHSQVKEGDHAYLGASKYHWINYDPDKLAATYRRFLKAQQGTELHAFAAQCIKLRQRLPRKNLTLNMHVNDAIGYRMTPEQVLYYSENCFGTADAISFNKDLLRIHDLKTGDIPAHMEQLEIYASLFCLEYNIKPCDIGMELRIYQSNEIIKFEPMADDILPIMEQIKASDKIIAAIKKEEGIT
ncbi:MAG TPA: hypothetical protein DCW90_05250 [Lachnospiraceae bacterium]|nr:hypothetical protein [Lachnospiraceae bacterium]